jgi:hypothetical protein
MKKIWQVLMAGVLLAGICACAATNQEVSNTDKPGGIVAQVVTEKGTVEAINYDDRTLTVKDSAGVSHFIKAGPEMVNFPQIKLGDEVIAKATQSIAIFVDKPENKSEASANQGGVVMLAPIGAKPGIVAAKVMEITATVENIDYGNRLVTLKGPQGNTITTTVDPSVKRFNNIKVGDLVYMQITEEFGIKVETPQK